MKQKAVLIIAVGMGILAFVLTHLYLKAELQKIYAGAERVIVLTPKENLASGTVLTEDNIGFKEMFKAGLGPNVLLQDNIGTAIGRVLLYPLAKGQPLDRIHIISDLEAQGGFARTISEGMRAMSIPVSTDTAVSGLIRPNDQVDILGTFSFIDEQNPDEMETVTFTVLQNVSVLATGQETGNSDFEISGTRRRGSYNTVTISVLPEEAELLAFAMNVKGTLTFTLRNPGDVDILDQNPPLNFQALQRDLPRLNEKRRRLNSSGGNLIRRQ
jgi:pilus assembly protein CpaB